MTNLATRALRMQVLTALLERAAPVSLDHGRAHAIAAEFLTPRRRDEARRALRQALTILDAEVTP